MLDGNARNNLKKLFESCQPPSPRPEKQRRGQNDHAREISSFRDASLAGESAVSMGGDIVSSTLATDPIPPGGHARNGGDASTLATDPIPPGGHARNGGDTITSGEDATVGALLVEDATAGGDITVPGEDSRLRPLRKLNEDDVALPSEIAEFFKKWKADPSAFVRGDCFHIPSSPIEHYDYARRAQTSLASNKILWRFVTTTYYDIISVRSQSNRYSITKEVVAFVVAVICQSSSYERETVEKHVID